MPRPHLVTVVVVRARDMVQCTTVVPHIDVTLTVALFSSAIMIGEGAAPRSRRQVEQRAIDCAPSDNDCQQLLLTAINLSPLPGACAPAQRAARALSCCMKQRARTPGIEAFPPLAGIGDAASRRTTTR